MRIESRRFDEARRINRARVGGAENEWRRLARWLEHLEGWRELFQDQISLGYWHFKLGLCSLIDTVPMLRLHVYGG